MLGSDVFLLLRFNTSFNTSCFSMFFCAAWFLRFVVLLIFFAVVLVYSGTRFLIRLFRPGLVFSQQLLVGIWYGMRVDLHGYGRVGVSEHAAYFWYGNVSLQHVTCKGVSPVMKFFVDAGLFFYLVPYHLCCRVV